MHLRNVASRLPRTERDVPVGILYAMWNLVSGDGIMAKIKLVDVDAKYRESKRRGKQFPNLALMKISAYHKARGDTVGFGIDNPDLTYISCVFTKNRLNAIKECCDTRNGIAFGGSGLSTAFNLSPVIEYSRPDYDLYPSEYSMGFTTRGCIRNCEFCIVRMKEGAFRRNQHIEEFHDFRFKSCKLLDNNILADVDWFFENTDWAIDNNVKLDITQGMDIRLMTPEIAQRLKRVKFVDQQMRFAFDDPYIIRRVEEGIQMLKDAGINTRRNVSFYVLAGFNGDNTAHQRCKILRDLRCNSFVMMYEETQELKALARWANRRQLYWSMNFDEYKAGA